MTLRILLHSFLILKTGRYIYPSYIENQTSPNQISITSLYLKSYPKFNISQHGIVTLIA